MSVADATGCVASPVSSAFAPLSSPPPPMLSRCLTRRTSNVYVISADANAVTAEMILINVCTSSFCLAKVTLLSQGAVRVIKLLSLDPN